MLELPRCGRPWRGEKAEHDRAALERLIARLRANDPAATLRSLVGDLGLERYPCLQGRAFRLQVGTGRGAHEVRLLAGPPADGIAAGSLSGPAGV